MFILKREFSIIAFIIFLLLHNKIEHLWYILQTVNILCSS
jgi:hypothetical protein